MKRTVARVMSGFAVVPLQAAAAARIAGKPNIFDAAQSGDLALVQDHVTADASCVGRRSGCADG